MLARTSIVASLVCVSAACGGGSADPPTCGDAQVMASGDPDGGEFTISFAVTQYVFVNALGGSSGYLEINNGNSAGELHLEWDELVANGDSVPARGQIIAGTGYGNCISGPLDSELTMSDDGEGGSFVLRNLRVGPPFCGDEIGGEIVGCFRSPP